MRVLLVANYARGRQHSMDRFAALMSRLLGDAGHEVRVTRPAAVAGRLASPDGEAGKWLGYLDRFVLFPPRLRAAVRWADVVHVCDHSNAMYVPFLGDHPHIVTCHDLIAIRSALGSTPEWRTRRTGRVQQWWALRGLRRARRVVCVSEETRRQLLALVPAARSSVVYTALNAPYRPMPAPERGDWLRRLGLGERPYLLHLGGNDWYKNRSGLLRLFHALRHEPRTAHLALVLAGRPLNADLRRSIVDLGLDGAVVEVRDPPTDGLRALYSGAQALIFPSLYEGFGMPVLEAQACGCPVFASNRAPLTEAGGDAAVYFDPADYAAAARTIADGLPHADAMRERGLQHATRFSESQMLQGYLDAYADAISTSSPRGDRTARGGVA